jgi:DNA-nicking Smr family endonuclease
MKKRVTTDEERALFKAVVAGKISLGGAKRLKTAGTATAKPAAKKASPMPSGVNGRTGRRLVLGEIEPAAKIDLHGMTEQAAHQALTSFLLSAQRRGARLVLVVTGKGARPPAPDEPFDLGYDRRARGVLKSMTPRWLSEPPLAGLIADLRSAHIRHGGAGAYYVYLRKTPKKFSRFSPTPPARFPAARPSGQ